MFLFGIRQALSGFSKQQFLSGPSRRIVRWNYSRRSISARWLIARFMGTIVAAETASSLASGRDTISARRIHEDLIRPESLIWSRERRERTVRSYYARLRSR